MTIRVLVVDDQSLIRSGLSVLIGSAPDLDVVAEAADGDAAVRLARELKPDVVLMDVRMPGRDGLSATFEICADPNLAGSRVLVLTTFQSEQYVFEALRAGASGFISKGIEPDELLVAIRVVHQGESLLSPQATRHLIAAHLARPTTLAAAGDDRLNVLTEREREIVALVATGLSNDDIAAELVLSPLTVRTHVNRAMTKLQVRDRAQLVVLAYQTRLVEPGRPAPGAPAL